MKKFLYAFNGIKDSLKQKAIITQFILAICAIIGGIIIKLNYLEWLAFVICIGLVISLEIMNSVVELLCDLYSKEYNEKIRMIKDMASGSVLIASIASLIVCIICLLRRF